MSKEFIESIKSLAAVRPFVNLHALNRSNNPTLAAAIEFAEFGHTNHLCQVGPHPSGFTGWEGIYKFPNGYGASVIRYQFMNGLVGSYGAEDGLWQLAVLDNAGHPCYSTHVTNDVLGWLAPEDVNAALSKIEALSPYQEEDASSPDEGIFFSKKVYQITKRYLIDFLFL